MERAIIADRYRVTQGVRPEGPVETYEAVDAAGADVAIKVIDSGSAGITARFAKDLEAALAIRHPNLARTLGWGRYEGSYYYVVREWIEGTNLAGLLREGPIPPQRAADFAMQACAGLESLHEQGIVHKDIRPETLVLGPSGTIKVIDVGIPRPGLAAPEDELPPYAAYYISPEQAEGLDPGPESDIYSLGVVLYHLTTGRVPFDGRTAHEIASQHLNAQPVPPRRRNLQITPSLEGVITRAMSKSPSRRYTSAEEMRRDLERAMALTEAEAQAPAPEAKKRMMWPWAAGAALLVVMALALSAWLVVTTPVPDLNGLTHAQAQQRLFGTGLEIGAISYRQPAPTGARTGAIVGQSLSPGSRARSGSAVDVIIAGPQQVSMPSLLNLSEAAAVAAIGQAKLLVGGVQSRFDARVPAGFVVAQSPDAGSLAPLETPVTLVVSRGTQAGAVPSVVGLTQTSAVAALENAGFKTRLATARSDSVSPGLVISQTPGPGTNADVGNTVSIVVSRGTGTVLVPDVIGLSQTAAANQLGRAGLGVRRITAESDRPTGTVIDQSPEGGGSVTPGTTVTITVARAVELPPPVIETP